MAEAAELPAQSGLVEEVRAPPSELDDWIADAVG